MPWYAVGELGLGRSLQAAVDTLRLTYGQRPRQLALAMSLLAYGEPAESSETDSPAAEAEPDVLVDFTAMLQRQRQNGDYGGWFGCDSKMQTTQSDQGYYLEQYVLGVLDFSSQYGIDYSISYTAANVIGRPTKFPAYGDYPETFPMVSPCRSIRTRYPFNSPAAHLRRLVATGTVRHA